MDSTINERLRKFVEMEQITFAVFRKVVHAPSAQQVSNWMTSRDNVPDKYIKETIIKYPKINARWLLTGEGEMYNTEQSNERGRNHEKEYKSVTGSGLSYREEIEDLNQVIIELEKSVDVIRKTVRTLRINLVETAAVFKK